MDYDRIVRQVIAGLMNPLLERRDYGGNQLDKDRDAAGCGCGCDGCTGGPGCGCCEECGCG